jgi:radical SAM protein with 4Fe4S-binding SPASM domain
VNIRSTREEARLELREEVPLAKPLMVRIDPSNTCNFRCAFCPTGDKTLLDKFGRKPAVMDWDFFSKITADIARWGGIPKIYLYKDGEPFLNKNLVKMIRRVKESGASGQVWTTTNGSFLSEPLSGELVDSGLDLIRISVYGVSSDDYQKISGIRFDYEKLVRETAFLYRRRKKLHLHVKLLDWGLLPEKKEKFVRDFHEISDSLHVDAMMGWSRSSLKDFTLGTHPMRSPDGLELTPKEVCPFPFYTLTVNSDGSVSVCCADWSHGTVVGDLRRESISEIWAGQRLAEFRKMHLRKERRRHPVCGDCQYLAIPPDCLDPYADELLKKMGFEK